MKDSTSCREFNADDILKFRIKEEWVFDKESSRMYARILGIAPIKTYVDENTGSVLGEAPIFWVYYPDLRPILAKYEVYNAKNFGARMSWEELFESRFFASYIVKSTLENPYDMFIKQYIKDDILRLLEGDNIKDKIFNFEQDLWSY
jgi:gliding motility associated protien GldN